MRAAQTGQNRDYTGHSQDAGRPVANPIVFVPDPIYGVSHRESRPRRKQKYHDQGPVLCNEPASNDFVHKKKTIEKKNQPEQQPARKYFVNNIGKKYYNLKEWLISSQHNEPLSRIRYHTFRQFATNNCIYSPLI